VRFAALAAIALWAAPAAAGPWDGGSAGKLIERGPCAFDLAIEASVADGRFVARTPYETYQMNVSGVIEADGAMEAAGTWKQPGWAHDMRFKGAFDEDTFRGKYYIATCYGTVTLYRRVSTGSDQSATDPAELERTWQAAKVRVPLRDETLTGRISDLVVPDGVRLPLVVYLHGCAGFWRGTDRTLDWLAEQGYAVIAPDGFARRYKPVSCDPIGRRGGLHRGVLAFRQAEADFALKRARTMAWVDADNVFLVGLSEGAITAATYSGGQPVNARVIEGWTCHAGWPEYGGLKAPAAEPVLSLVSGDDPWFQLAVLKGDCGPYLKNDASRSVVFREAPLGHRHDLLWHDDARALVRDFLARNRR